MVYKMCADFDWTMVVSRIRTLPWWVQLALAIALISVLFWFAVTHLTDPGSISPSREPGEFLPAPACNRLYSHVVLPQIAALLWNCVKTIMWQARADGANPGIGCDFETGSSCWVHAHNFKLWGSYILSCCYVSFSACCCASQLVHSQRQSLYWCMSGLGKWLSSLQQLMLIMLCFADPIVSALDDETVNVPERDLYIKDMKEQWTRPCTNGPGLERYCRTCQIWRPPRASHCNKCGYCIVSLSPYLCFLPMLLLNTMQKSWNSNKESYGETVVRLCPGSVPYPTSLSRFRPFLNFVRLKP